MRSWRKWPATQVLTGGQLRVPLEWFINLPRLSEKSDCFLRTHGKISEVEVDRTIALNWCSLLGGVPANTSRWFLMDAGRFLNLLSVWHIMIMLVCDVLDHMDLKTQGHRFALGSILLQMHPSRRSRRWPSSSPSPSSGRMVRLSGQVGPVCQDFRPWSLANRDIAFRSTASKMVDLRPVCDFQLRCYPTCWICLRGFDIDPL